MEGLRRSIPFAKDAVHTVNGGVEAHIRQALCIAHVQTMITMTATPALLRSWTATFGRFEVYTGMEARVVATFMVLIRIVNLALRAIIEADVDRVHFMKIFQLVGFWGFGVLGFWGFGVLGFWGFGVLGFWGFGVLGF